MVVKFIFGFLGSCGGSRFPYNATNPKKGTLTIIWLQGFGLIRFGVLRGRGLGLNRRFVGIPVFRAFGLRFSGGGGGTRGFEAWGF